MTAKAPSALRRFVTRWEMVWYVVTVLLYTGAIGSLIWLFPDVSNTWIGIFVLAGGFTASVGTMISAIKTRGSE